MKTLLPQKCPLVFLYASWLLYLGGIVFFMATGNFVMAVIWLIAVPGSVWLYIRVFPGISVFVGYGRVDDVVAENVEPEEKIATMYSSLGCPFCPIVENRLRELKKKMDFDLTVVDVTLSPDLIRKKGIWSVPVVEVGDHRIVGHATTRELADLVTRANQGSSYRVCPAPVRSRK